MYTYTYRQIDRQIDIDVYINMYVYLFGTWPLLPDVARVEGEKDWVPELYKYKYTCINKHIDRQIDRQIQMYI